MTSVAGTDAAPGTELVSVIGVAALRTTVSVEVVPPLTAEGHKAIRFTYRARTVLASVQSVRLPHELAIP